MRAKPSHILEPENAVLNNVNVIPEYPRNRHGRCNSSRSGFAQPAVHIFSTYGAMQGVHKLRRPVDPFQPTAVEYHADAHQESSGSIRASKRWKRKLCFQWVR